MKPEELREQWEKENPSGYEKYCPGKRFDWERAIITKNECAGHGDYGDETYANIKYAKWLEQKICQCSDSNLNAVLGEVYGIACPFCGECDFDFIGLKSHLEHGDCEKYINIEKRVRLFPRI